MRYFLALILSLILMQGFTQKKSQVIYKKVDTVSLRMEIIFPVGHDTSKTYPAMVFFFGGGWNGGTNQQFKPHAEYFSNRGVVSFLVDYRVNKRHKTSPFEALKDAKSAMRFVRKHAEKYNVDPQRIIAVGGSAGGHLAAATALVKAFNAETDDINVSCVPNALVLYNPVLDNGPGGYGYERVKERYKDFSPLHNIEAGAPPTLIFLGTRDKLIPVETVSYYRKVMEKVGSRCDLMLYEGEPHGFFNYKNLENYKKTVSETDRFLTSLGFVNEK